MRRLREDHLNLTRRGIDPRRRFGISRTFLVLVLLSVALLVLSRLDVSWVNEARWQASELIVPVQSAVADALAPLRSAGRAVSEIKNLAGEITALRDENRRLKAAEGRVGELERRLADITALARVVVDQALPFVTARVIASSSSSVASTVSINAGRGSSIRSGYPVVNRDGLVGRIVDTGQSAARVLLLTDLSSRIPVLVGRGSLRAVATGDGGPRLRLSFVTRGATIAAGDEVVTSGAGGLFPRGLQLGRVVDDGGTFKVEPFAALDDLDHVSVLLHDTPVVELYGDASPGPRDDRPQRPSAGSQQGVSVPERGGAALSGARSP